MTQRHSVALLAGAGLAVGLLAGCGSSTSTDSSFNASKQTSGASSAALATVDKEYAQYQDPDPVLSIAPLGKKAPAGKTIDIITCPVAICATYTAAAEQASKALGWKTKVLVSQLSPTAFQATWNTIDQDKPNVVFDANSAPLSDISTQVLKAKADGSVIVAYGVAQAVGTTGSTPAARAFSYNANGPNAEVQNGHVQGLEVLHDSRGKASVLILDDPSVGAVVAAEVGSEEQTLKAGGASYSVQDVSSANIGTTIPSTLVTYLRAHPSVNYVTVPFDDYTPGIPEALQSAGLASKVKLVGSAADESSQKEVAAGQIFASAATATQANAWLMIDAAVRVLSGDSISDANPAGPIAVLEKSSSSAIGSATAWPSSVYAKLRSAWGVS